MAESGCSGALELPVAGRSRLALYYVPETDSPLGAAAAAWLGRTSRGFGPVSRVRVPGLAESRLIRLTAPAYHYGFHATLKPPFRLRPEADPASLHRCLSEFAATRRPVEVGRLELATLNDFICLRPGRSCPGLEALAADIVRAFDGFRQAPAAEEMARRRTAGLNARQEELLAAWGYPYVLDQFRFHLTLTGSITDDAERDRLFCFLHRHFRDPLEQPVSVEAITLMIEEDGRPLIEAGRYRFAGTRRSM